MREIRENNKNQQIMTYLFVNYFSFSFLFGKFINNIVVESITTMIYSHHHHLQKEAANFIAFFLTFLIHSILMLQSSFPLFLQIFISWAYNWCSSGSKGVLCLDNSTNVTCSQFVLRNGEIEDLKKKCVQRSNSKNYK